MNKKKRIWGADAMKGSSRGRGITRRKKNEDRNSFVGVGEKNYVQGGPEIFIAAQSKDSVVDLWQLPELGPGKTLSTTIKIFIIF
jgi:hypothetical protein